MLKSFKSEKFRCSKKKCPELGHFQNRSTLFPVRPHYSLQQKTEVAKKYASNDSMLIEDFTASLYSERLADSVFVFHTRSTSSNLPKPWMFHFETYSVAGQNLKC